jgi:hypothetical protein
MSVSCVAGSQGIKFSVTRNSVANDLTVDGSVWVSTEWRHIAWTLAPTLPTTSFKANWTVYVDAVFKDSTTGWYPPDVQSTNNLIGKNQTTSEAPYDGLLDSFLIYAQELNASQVVALAQVQYRLHVCMHLPFLCVCVCMQVPVGVCLTV